MLGVLGPFEVDIDITPRSQAQRVIASALVLDVGIVVTADRLAELVWGDDQPADSSAALQSHVSRLRRVLPDGIEILAEGSGYVIKAPPDRIDIVRFEANHQRACAANDDESRLQATEAALALWRGNPYPDLDDPRATAQRIALLEQHRELTELRAESLVRLGRPGEAISGLEAARIDNPMSERAVEWLMRAYAGSGRKTDALDAFTRLRTDLVEQTGLDPSPGLRELETAIITGEFVGFAPTAGSLSAERPKIAIPASTFIGRDAEVEAIAEVLRQSRIVSLVGPGGVGKSRLALHVAAATAGHFDEVVDVVELAALQQGDQLAEWVSTTLSLQPRANSTATERVVDAAGTRRRLLVLDNCEHVIEAAARFVDTVVRSAPNVTFLATSREPLNVDGEIVERVEPLAVEGPAVELFTDRASRLASGVSIGDTNRHIVEQICESLDGLPLAIELAAAQMGSMTLDEIAEGVAEPLELLSKGRRTADERHRSLRRLMEWSVQELDETLLSVFTGTAAFAGPFTAAALATVSDHPLPEVRSALTELADRSLVVADPASGMVTRFTTLVTIRAYAAELLSETGRVRELGDRHSEWVLDLVKGISTNFDDWVEAEKADVVATHLADLRVAHERFMSNGDADRALRLAASLHFSAYYAMHAEIFSWITAVADRFGEAEHPDTEAVLASAAVGAWQAGDLDKASEYASRAEAASETTSPGAGRGAAEVMADIFLFSGDQTAAREKYEQAVAIGRIEGNHPRIVNDLADLAMVSGYLGDLDGARSAIAEARDLLGAGAPMSCRAWVDYTEGETLVDHDPDTAVRLLSAAIEMAEECDAAFIIGTAGLSLVGLQLRGDEPIQAIPGIVRLMKHWRQRGARVQQWISLRSVIELFVRLDRPEDAAAVLGALLTSDTAEDVSGTDADRLATARATVMRDVPDADQILANWAGRDQDQIVDFALTRLEAYPGPTGAISH